MRQLSNLPPGVTDRMIEEQATGGNEICECCGRHIDECVCEECPRCHATGNPDCYEGTCTEHAPCPRCFEGECTHDGGMNCPPPRLRYTKEQRKGQARVRIKDLESRIADEALYLELLEEKPDSWRDE